MPSAGETICGRIRLEARAPRGHGAAVFGPTYAARTTDADERLWLTIISRDLIPSSVDVSRFMAGANELTSVRHPSLVRTVVVDREPEYVIVGYEALPGARMLSEVALEGPDPDLLQRVAVELARSLAVLHRRGRLHGALGPANVAIWEGGPLLWQYGIAELCVPDRFVQAAAKVGDEAIAPEIRDGQSYDPRTDVYGWGACVAALATSQGGVKGVAALLDDAFDPLVPVELAALAQLALLDDPRQRPSDAVDLLRRLDHAAMPGSALAELAQRYLHELGERKGPPGRAAKPVSGKRPPPPPAPPPPAADDDDVVSLDEIEAEAVEDEPTTFERGKGRAEARRAPRRRASSDSAPDLRQLIGPQGSMEPPPEEELERVVGELMQPAPEPLDDPFLRAPTVDEPQTPKPPSESPRQPTARPRAAFRPPRLPGPHGPRGGAMALVAVLVTSALSLGLTPVVASRHGGLRKFLGIAEPVPEAASRDPETEPMHGAVEPANSVAAPPDECPADTVEIGAFGGAVTCIERHEYPAAAEYPRIEVTLTEAKALCARRGRRLCTTAEWRRACRGPDARRYPYGDEYQQDACNTASAAGLAQNLVRAGARDLCVTSEGVHDMVGNVAEWVEEGSALGGDSTMPSPSCSTRVRLGAETTGPALGFRCCLSLLRGSE